MDLSFMQLAPPIDILQINRPYSHNSFIYFIFTFFLSNLFPSIVLFHSLSLPTTTIAFVLPIFIRTSTYLLA